MKTESSWIVVVTGAGKSSRHVVAANNHADAVRTGENYTGHRVTKAWPATGKYRSLHDGRVSSGRTCIAA